MKNKYALLFFALLLLLFLFLSIKLNSIQDTMVRLDGEQRVKYTEIKCVLCGHVYFINNQLLENSSLIFCPRCRFPVCLIETLRAAKNYKERRLNVYIQKAEKDLPATD